MQWTLSIALHYIVLLAHGNGSGTENEVVGEKRECELPAIKIS